MPSSEIETLIQILSKLPGLGPRSARRATLELIKKKEQKLYPLLEAMKKVSEDVKICQVCSNVDTQSPCAICADPNRDQTRLCLVADVADLWALERTNIFKGQYYVLGGLLSAIDGIGPEELKIEKLLMRLKEGKIEEVIFALPATIEGKTTEHYITDRIRDLSLQISELAHGVPVGGELDYLDDGTIGEAFKARKKISI